MKILINRILITIYALVCNLHNRLREENKLGKTIIIVFQQIFGDAVVFSNSLYGYTELFPERKGYKIILLGRPDVIKFMRETMPIPHGIILEKVDFRRLMHDFKYFRDSIKRYEKSDSIMIVPGTSLSADVFCTACNSGKKIGLMQSLSIKWPPAMVLFRKLAYTDTLCPDKTLMMLQRHRLLLNMLGLKSYKAMLPGLLLQKKIATDIDYCVVCPGASTMEKCWPIDRYIEIINYIISKFDFDVYLCGGNGEEVFGEQILENVCFPVRVKNHIGKTTFTEWSSLVQHSEFVIGNDSATMHLAAASKKTAICIAGVFDKFQFFPYKVDCLADGDILPVTILHDMSCSWCRTRGYYSGYQNPKCRSAIKNNKPVLCIEEIKTEEVKEKINQLIQNGTRRNNSS